MRPETLQLQGFTAYREMAEPVSFSGVDLFALTGPTGAGKSSLIDAMCFALYGKVPRLPANQVEPVISLGRNEARVDFAFTLGGSRYRIVRVVRRQKAGGATTAEARLEGPDLTVAGADLVTQAVESLVGLSFAHFTRCVVLPQGEFAAFLHDQPGNRQKLLKSLLDLGLYERVRQAALVRRQLADSTADTLESLIQDLGQMGPEAEREAAQRVSLLEGLLERVNLFGAEWEDLNASVAELEHRQARLSNDLDLLGAVAAPPGLETLAEKRAGSQDRWKAAVDAMEAAARDSEKRTADLSGMRSLSVVQVLIDGFERRALLAGRLTTGAEVTAVAAASLERAEQEEEAKSEAMVTAEAAVERHKDAHRAHSLRAGLAVGAACPVCLQPVDTLPESETPSETGEVEGALAQARTALDAARKATREARQHHDRSHAQLQALGEQAAELDQALEGSDEAATRSEHLAVSEALALAEAASLRGRQTQKDLATARLDLDALAASESAARIALDAARLRVAALDPPEAGREDLATDWNSLITWAGTRGVSTRGALEAAAGELALLTEQKAARAEALRQDAEGVGVVAAPDQIRDATVAALAAVRERHRHVVEQGERLVEYRETGALQKRNSAVAAALARALDAKGFEAWVLEEALHGLIEGANQVLESLAGGQYQLDLVRRDFEVIDRRNADQRRSVRTLSGGETFLVSLALALSLAERIASLSISGATRLDAIFLDEGFGTLDADSLDSVAAVLHELSGGERMVGIVTHVKELAEQMPVRYLVSNGPSGAVVRMES